MTEGADHSAGRYAIYPSLKGRAVLITGGATGIGASLVLHFAGQGARIAFLDIQNEPAQELAASIAANGHPEPVYLPCDLADTTAIAAAVASAVASLGGLDVLVNNAGNDQRHATEEVTPEMWDDLMAINLRQQFFVTQAALPALKASWAASVINMSSISWMIPSTRQAVYISAFCDDRRPHPHPRSRTRCRQCPGKLRPPRSHHYRAPETSVAHARIQRRSAQPPITEAPPRPRRSGAPGPLPRRSRQQRNDWAELHRRRRLGLRERE